MRKHAHETISAAAALSLPIPMSIAFISSRTTCERKVATPHVARLTRKRRVVRARSEERPASTKLEARLEVEVRERAVRVVQSTKVAANELCQNCDWDASGAARRRRRAAEGGGERCDERGAVQTLERAVRVVHKPQPLLNNVEAEKRDRAKVSRRA